MAKLEIPSIVVQNGSSSSSSSSSSTGASNTSGMEKPLSAKHKSKLSKQAEFEEIDDPESETLYDLASNNEVDEENTNQNADDEIVNAGGDSLQRSESTDSEKDISGSTKSRTKSNKSKRLGKQGSSQGSATSFEGSTSSLSRESSTEAYTDSTGIDLQQFIIDTLHKNQKDRMMLLKIESELINFAKEGKHTFHKFPQMSSYHRMLVHRCAAFFGMDHNVDPSGTSVVVNKTKSTRIPDFKFKEQIKDELLPHEPRKSILKRDCASFDDKEFRGLDKSFGDSKRSKSFEEREEEYEKARARIFNQDEGLLESTMLSGPVTLYGRTSDGSTVVIGSSQLSSQEDVRWAMIEPRPWSSTDSDSSGRPITLPVKTCLSPDVSLETLLLNKQKATKLRPQIVKAHSDCQDFLSVERVHRVPVTKASSFCGMSSQQSIDTLPPSLSSIRSTNSESVAGNHSNSSGNVLARAPSSSSIPSPQSTHADSSSAVFNSNIQPQPYILPNQTVADNSWKQSVNQNTDVASQTAPMAIAHAQPMVAQPQQQQQQPIMWAVSSFDSVPPGSILINPLSGMPYLNPDGTVYRHNPSVTPIIYQTPASNSSSTPADLVNASCSTSSSSSQSIGAASAATPIMHHVPPQQQQQQQILYYPHQSAAAAAAATAQPALPQDGPSGDADYINQFSMINIGQSHQSLETNAAEGVQHALGASTPVNGSSYTCLTGGAAGATQMCIVPSQVTPNSAFQSTPAHSHMQYSTNQSVYYPHQPLALQNQSHQLQTVPQPIAGYGGSGYDQQTSQQPQTQQQQTGSASAYMPSSHTNYHPQLTSVVKSASPLQCHYNPHIIQTVSSSRAQNNVMTVPQYGVTQNQQYGTVAQLSSHHQQQQQQATRPLVHHSGALAAVASNMNFSSLSSNSMATPPSPQYPSSSYTTNPLASYNVIYPSVPGMPARNKADIAAATPPAGLPPSTQSHSFIAHMSSSPQLTKSCSFPPMDGQFIAADHAAIDSFNNAGYQFIGTPMQQRTRFSISPPIRGSLLIPRQPMIPVRGHQPWLQQQAQQAVIVNKPQKLKRQRSRQDTPSVNSNSPSNDSSATSSLSQTPTLVGKSNILEVQGFPSGMKRIDMDRYLEEISEHGGKIEYVPCDADKNSAITGTDSIINSAKCKIIAVFESDSALQSALLNIKSSKFELRLQCSDASQ